MRLPRHSVILVLAALNAAVLNAQTNDVVPASGESSEAITNLPAITETTALAPTPVLTNAPAVTNPPTMSDALLTSGAATMTNVVTITNTVSITNLVEVEPPFRRLSLIAEAGLSGFGGALSWRFTDHLGLRGGMDYFPTYSKSGSEDLSTDEVSGPVDYQAHLALQSEPLTLDVYPWRKHSFHISLGALFNQSNLKVQAMPTEGIITINGNDYFVDPGGRLNLKINQPTVCPYLSIGGNFFYFDHAHHVSMGGELGVAYGKWNVSLTSQNIQDPGDTLTGDLKAAQKQLSDRLQAVPLFPVIKLNLCYSF
jgi:hypothetical protein